MNKGYRAKLRIERDFAKKRAKRAVQNSEYDNYDKVFTMQHAFPSLAKCRLGVDWKGSVQSYTQNAITNIYKLMGFLICGKMPPLKDVLTMYVRERGKERKITSIKIDYRVPQRMLCDYSLVPVLRNTLIFDNGASLPGKGVDFTRKRVRKMLVEATKEFGPVFYILVFDFKSYFDSIAHCEIRKILNKHFADKRIIDITMDIIKSYQFYDIMMIKDEDERQTQLDLLFSDKLCGICLGSQVSQIIALVFANDIDHYIKDKCGIKYYARYMDDGVAAAKTKEELLMLFEGMKKIAGKLKLTFSPKKTHIVKSTKGFSFLKVKYHITHTGKIISRLTHNGIHKMRTRLCKFHNKVVNGKMTLDDVYNSVQSWYAHAGIAMSYTTRKSMDKLYNELFGGYRITKSWKRNARWAKKKNTNKEINYEILQIDRWAEYRWNCDAA